MHSTGFKLTEVPESNEVILFKKDPSTGYTIEIIFEARCPNNIFFLKIKKKKREKNINTGEKPDPKKKNKDEAELEFEPTDEEEYNNEMQPHEKKDEIEMQQEDLYKDYDGKIDFETCDFTVFFFKKIFLFCIYAA